MKNISNFFIKVQILDHATPLYLTSLHPPVYRSVSSPSIAKNQDKWDLLLLLLLLFLRSSFFVLRCFRSYTVTDVHAEYARQVLSFVPVYLLTILHHYFYSDSDVLHSHSWGNVRQCRERRATMCNYGNNNWQYSSLMKHRCDEASDTRKEKNHRLQQWSFRI